LAGLRVRLLTELGRIEEAIACGRDYLELCQSEQLVTSDAGIVIGLAQAFAAAGRFPEALSTLEPFIDSREKLGCEGLALGILYETRARLAIRAGDRGGFERSAELCAHEYRKANNPALIARFARLLEDARQHELGDIESAPDVRELLLSLPPESEYNTVHSRILECVDDGDRARCALTLLLQSTEGITGYLYGVRDGRAVLLAALPEPPADAELAQWVDECLQSELESGENATVDDGADALGGSRTDAARAYFDEERRCFEPVFLFATQGSAAQIAAILVLHMPAGPRVIPPRPLLEELAHELLDHGDVSGIVVDDVATG
jgi:tetratricopeptide (TPR) repeat protein